MHNKTKNLEYHFIPNVDITNPASQWVNFLHISPDFWIIFFLPHFVACPIVVFSVQLSFFVSPIIFWKLSSQWPPNFINPMQLGKQKSLNGKAITKMTFYGILSVKLHSLGNATYYRHQCLYNLRSLAKLTNQILGEMGKSTHLEHQPFGWFFIFYFDFDFWFLIHWFFGKLTFW